MCPILDGQDSIGDFWRTAAMGRVIGTGTADQNEVVIVRCTRRYIEDQRRGWPFLRDRRVDSYGALTTHGLGGLGLTRSASWSDPGV